MDLQEPLETRPAARGAAAVTVIVNASAGTARIDGGVQRLEAACRERGLQAQVVSVHSGGDITAAVQDALDRGVRTVVAGGGDGTVSAVASLLAGTEATLGVLPLGTLNHFAKDLGLPLELEAALDVVARGRTLAVDVGEVNGRVFVNNSSLGLYPRIVLDRERQCTRLGRGKWMALAAASLHVLRRSPVLPVEVEVGGRMLQRRSPFVFIGNNRYAIEGFEIGSRESLCDGRLSLYLAQHTGRFGLLALAVRALFGRLRQASDFDMLSAAALVVRTRRKAIHVAADGEILLMQTPLHYRVRPGALQVRVPDADAAASRGPDPARAPGA